LKILALLSRRGGSWLHFETNRSLLGFEMAEKYWKYGNIRIKDLLENNAKEVSEV
jgi:hypothetical protein